MEQTSTRAGEYVLQPGGHHAFITLRLPPDPPIRMETELWGLLSRADRALGRVDGATELLPNPSAEARVARFGWAYGVGDKVMQVENAYDKDVYNSDVQISLRKMIGHILRPATPPGRWMFRSCSKNGAPYVRSG